MPLSDRKCFLTGASGFVGKSVISFFGGDNFRIWNRNESFQLDGAISVIHLAGKAHDLKNISNPEEYYTVNTSITHFLDDPREKLLLFLLGLEIINDLEIFLQKNNIASL